MLESVSSMFILIFSSLVPIFHLFRKTLMHYKDLSFTLDLNGRCRKSKIGVHCLIF